MESLVTINHPQSKPSTIFTFPSFTSVNYSSFSLFKFNGRKKFNKSSITVNCLNHQNPIKSFPYLIQKARDFAAKSVKNKWAAAFRDYCAEESGYLQNGAFGTALMSVTATAKVKISPILSTLAANPTFVSGLCAWAVAQSTKIFLNFYVERKWDFRVIFASGGMPSSHSALCTALTTSVAICHGVADSLFPVCLGFSLIVMYDAIGVRRHAGMQAEVLNLIVEDLFQGHPISKRKLKELLGHTPSQVFVGALLGIVIAWACSRGRVFPCTLLN
ncbi:hypothetical protein ABFX02_02G176600 [Erythranthe guttata]